MGGEVGSVVQPSHSVGASGPTFEEEIAQRGALGLLGCGMRRPSRPDRYDHARGVGQRRTTLDAGDPRALPAPGPGHRRAGPPLRRRPAAASTSWAARCATPSPATRRRRAPRTSTSPPTPARRGRAPREGLGRRRVAPGQALRHHRAPPRRPALSRSPPTAPRPTSRLAQARGVVRRLHRGRPVAPRLHRQRHGPAPPRPRARRPLRRARRPGRRAGCARRWRPRSPSPTTRCGCCARRASSPASASSPSPRSPSRSRPCTTGCPSSRPSGSATSSTSWSSVDKPSPGLWFIVETGLADEFLPELPGLALEQDPIHRHKDVLAHTLAVVDKTGPDRLLRLAALLHDIGKPRTRAFGARRGHLPPPRGRRGPHDPRPAHGAALPAGRHRGRDQAGRAPPALPHLPAGVDRPRRASLRARRRAPARAAERAHPLATAPPATRPGPGPSERRMDELEAPHRRAAGPRRSSTRSGPSSTAVRSWTTSGLAPGPVVGQALDFLLELRLDEGPLGEEEAYRRLDAWWETRCQSGDRRLSPAQSSGQTGLARPRRTPRPGGRPRRRGTAPAATS